MNKFSFLQFEDGYKFPMKNDFLSLRTIYTPTLSPIVVQPGTPFSDHKPFWDEGYGAVLVGESWETNDQTPYYHSSNDKLATLDLSYYHEMVKLVASYTATKANIVKVLSNEELLHKKFNIYPNPNNGTFSIFSNYEKLHYIVYNLLGEKIKSGNLNYRSNKIEMPGLKPGIYLIVFKNRETTIPPIKMPKKPIIKGSIILVKPSIAAFTSTS